MERIGFIGAGIMGKPMIKNLINAGFSLYVFARRKEVCQKLAEYGATVLKSVHEVAKSCSIIIAMLPDSPQSQEVITGSDGILSSAAPGTLVIDMSSIDPTVSIKIAKKLKQKQIGFLDAPVSGGEKGAIEGKLAIMVGGSQGNFNRAVPIFKILGKSYTLVGDTGSGNYTKLANQVIVAINIAAVSEAMLLVKKAGLSPNKVYSAIKDGLAGSAVLDAKAPMITSRNFNPGFRISLHQKDMQNVLNAGSSLNLPLPLSSMLLEILKSLSSQGNGELDHSAIAKFYEQISGIEIIEK